MDGNSAGAVGTALIVSEDAVVTRQLAEAMQDLALSVEVWIKPSGAVDRVRRSKLEVVVIDFALGNLATLLVQQVRSSLSNRSAVTFAITGSSSETTNALNAGCNFALEKPLTYDSIQHTFRAAFGLIIRERRRYFRYPICVPAMAHGKGEPEIYGETVNVSEQGMAFGSATPLTPGTEVTIQFTLTKPQLAVAATCKVCWTNDKRQSGLLFLYLHSDVRSELHAWIAQKLEEQLPEGVTRMFQ